MSAAPPRTERTPADPQTALIDQIEHLFHEIIWRGRRRFARRLEAFGLTAPQYLVLDTVEKLGPGATMGDISDALQLPPSSMTSITDRLVRDGLVTRGSVPDDRRAVVATITPLGADVARRVEAVRHGDLVAMLDGVSAADLERFRFVLGHMLADVERDLAGP